VNRTRRPPLDERVTKGPQQPLGHHAAPRWGNRETQASPFA
jgi:hypothetical protein